MKFERASAMIFFSLRICSCCRVSTMCCLRISFRANVRLLSSLIWTWKRREKKLDKSRNFYKKVRDKKDHKISRIHCQEKINEFLIINTFLIQNGLAKHSEVLKIQKTIEIQHYQNQQECWRKLIGKGI